MNYNKYLTIVAVVLLLFGGSILPPELSKILSNPIVKFGLIPIYYIITNDNLNDNLNDNRLLGHLRKWYAQ